MKGMQHMKKSALAICMVFAACSSMADFAELREAIDMVMTNVNRKTLRVFTAGEIGGLGVCRHPSYQALASRVSNDWQNVVGNVGSIATNQTERYLLLATGVQYGWDFHLPFFTKIVDECLAGNISSNEIAWFESYSTRPGLVDQLYYRNTDTAVTNLLHNLILVDGDTNRWLSIMAPNAHEKVQEYIEAGILYIPE